MQDDSGKPVPLTKKGRRTWLGMHFGHTLPDFIRVEPGFASSDRLQLDDYFDLTKPGKYTVAHWGASPLRSTSAPGSKTTETPSPPDVYRPNDPFAKRWQDALTVAGEPHGDLVVEADLPHRPARVNLVLSVRTSAPPGGSRPDGGTQTTARTR